MNRWLVLLPLGLLALGLGAVPARADEPVAAPQTPRGSGPAEGRDAAEIDAAARTFLTDLRVGLAFQDRLARTLPPEGVVKVFEPLARAAPANQIVRFLLARATGGVAGCATMRTALERRLGLPVSERVQIGAGWFALARSQVEAGQLDAALESAGFSMRLVPQASGYALLAWIQQRRGDAAQAMSAYRTALRMDPRDLGARLALTDLCLRANQVEEALVLGRGTLLLAPRSALGQLYWGQALSLSGSVDEGRKAYLRSLRLASDDPDQVAAVSGALRRIDGQALAYEALQRVHASHPEHRGVLVQLVGIQIETGRAQEALDALAEPLRTAPGDAALWFLRGLAADGVSDAREAAASYRRASTLDADRLDYRLALGSALARSGDDKQALSVYRAAVQRFPAEPRAKELYARTMLDQHQYVAASEAFEELTRLTPNDPNPCYFLAVIKGVHLAQLADAKFWLERYAALGGTEAAALSWLEDLRHTVR